MQHSLSEGNWREFYIGLAVRSSTIGETRTYLEKPSSVFLNRLEVEADVGRFPEFTLLKIFKKTHCCLVRVTNL